MQEVGQQRTHGMCGIRRDGAWLTLLLRGVPGVTAPGARPPPGCSKHETDVSVRGREPRAMPCMRQDSPVLLRLAVCRRPIPRRPFSLLHVVASILHGRVPACQPQASDRRTLVGIESNWSRPAPTPGT